MTSSQHVYEVCPRHDKRGVDLISDVLTFGRLWYAKPSAIGNTINYAKFFSRSHPAVIRVYDEAGNVIERISRLVVLSTREFLTRITSHFPPTKKPPLETIEED